MADEQELQLYGEIGPSWMGMISDTAVIAALEEMKSLRRIAVRLNSPGGDAFMGVSIMNALRRHPAKVTVHIDALAASAASIIAMGGDKVIVHQGAMLMVHRAWTIALGNSEDLSKVAETLAKVDQNLVDIYARKTGLDKSKVKQLVDAETWMTAEEAVDLGFADEANLIGTGAKAALPEGWYSKAPATLARYSLPEKQKAAAGLGLSIAASVPPDLKARRDQLERLKKQLKVA